MIQNAGLQDFASFKLNCQIPFVTFGVMNYIRPRIIAAVSICLSASLAFPNNGDWREPQAGMQLASSEAGQSIPIEPNITDFLDSLFMEFYEKYKEANSDEFTQFCEKYEIDSANVNNQRIFHEIHFYHELLTGKGAIDGVSGGILRIPYFWHWIDPNPRHEILMLPDSTPLVTHKAPSEFSRYKSYADIDRVPSLFLSDMVTESPRYYHTNCGAFYTFGWCSEREMSYCILMSARGYSCKIKQAGIHTWSGVLISFETKRDDAVLMSAAVDNTFDSVRWILLNSSINLEDWLTDYGSGSDAAWYNDVFRSEGQKARIQSLKVSKTTRDRIEGQVARALK